MSYFKRKFPSIAASCTPKDDLTKLLGGSSNAAFAAAVKELDEETKRASAGELKKLLEAVARKKTECVNAIRNARKLADEQKAQLVEIDNAIKALAAGDATKIEKLIEDGTIPA